MVETLRGHLTQGVVEKAVGQLPKGQQLSCRQATARLLLAQDKLLHEEGAVQDVDVEAKVSRRDIVEVDLLGFGLDETAIEGLVKVEGVLDQELLVDMELLTLRPNGNGLQGRPVRDELATKEAQYRAFGLLTETFGQVLSTTSTSWQCWVPRLRT